MGDCGGSVLKPNYILNSTSNYILNFVLNFMPGQKR